MNVFKEITALLGWLSAAYGELLLFLVLLIDQELAWVEGYR